MINAKIVGINGRYTHSCLALFYVRNELNKHFEELDTELLQFTINDNYYEVLLKLSQGDPDYIFFSAAIWNSDLIHKLTLDLHQCLPDCKVIIGGPQATVIGESLDMSGACLVVGEVEAIKKTFYDDLRTGNLKPCYNASLFEMKSIDFSYPYRDVDFLTHLKNRHIYYESSKGCPFKCTYCLSAAQKGLFHKKMDTVTEEIRHLISFKPKIVRFIDRTFNDNPERALAIWELLIAEGGETLFHFEMAPDRFTEDMFDFLSTIKHGKFQFEIGIQSTNPKTLEAINRNTNGDAVVDTVQRLADLGTIHLHVDLILGLPYETRETFAESFRTVFGLGAHYIQMGLLKILPNTPMHQSMEEFGIKYCHNPPYSVIETKLMEHSCIRELYWFSECVEKFHNNRYFNSFWKYLRSTDEDMYLFFNGLLEHCRGGGFFERASTQELLCESLVTYIKKRNDRAILIEILRYDWLRCNYRFLPECLQVIETEYQPQRIRSRLYQTLPQEIEGVYTKGSRNQFFRKSFFLRISQKAAEIIGLNVKFPNQCCCFVAERQEGLFSFNKVLIL